MSGPNKPSPALGSATQPDQPRSDAKPTQLPAASVAQATPTTTESANTIASSDLSNTESRWSPAPYRPKKAKQRSKHFPPSSRYTVETQDDESDQELQSNDDAPGTKFNTTKPTTSEGSHGSTQNTRATAPYRGSRNWRERSPAQPSPGYGPGTYSHTIDLSTLATLVYQNKVYIRVGWAEGHRINKEYWAYARVEDGSVHQVFGCGIVFDERPMFYESKFARKDVEAWTHEISEAVARVEARKTDGAMPRKDAYARLTTTRANGRVTGTWQPDVSASVPSPSATYRSTNFIPRAELDELAVDALALTPAGTNQSTTFRPPADLRDRVQNPRAPTTEQSTSLSHTGRAYDTAQLLTLARTPCSASGVLNDDLLAKLSSLEIAQGQTRHANPSAIIRALLKHCHSNTIPEDTRIRSLFGFQALASMEEETKLLRMYQDAIKIGLNQGRLEGWLHRYMLFGKIIELFDRQHSKSESQRWLSANIATLQAATLQSVFDWVSAAKELRNKDNLPAESSEEPAFDYNAMAADIAAAAKGLEDEVSDEELEDVEVEAKTQDETSAYADKKDIESCNDAWLGPWPGNMAESAMADDLVGVGDGVGAAGEVMGDLIDFGEDETTVLGQVATSDFHQQEAEAEDEGTKLESSKASKAEIGGEEFWGLL